ncbi:MAG: phosphoribosylaminoimidazole carboxylase catalytic subunit [Thermoplasmatales archaeon E-plasma]|jgi:5-(carboxyamino)imidazole ribonucleotide mutase|nr:MAG: phosphoribosylaminoimidazole carboxylase catalytic subunit [Thermoplasmatales archaeon E-plasma]
MPSVSIIMGSRSDLEVMKEAKDIFDEFSVESEIKIVSAHRTPQYMYEFAKSASSRGIKVIIAGAGGSAHLPGMTASLTTLPVIGVPISTKSLKGMDSLLSIVQMPFGIPVATVAINGSKNAALLAIRILAVSDSALSDKLKIFMERQTKAVMEDSL